MKLRIFPPARYLWREWIKPLALVAALVFPFKSAVADWNWIPSGSMRPTLLEGELVFVNKLAYDLKVPFTLSRLAQWRDPQRGDIVVFFSPLDGTRLVKRVVGLPGDRLALRHEQLIINGNPVAWEASDPRWRHYATPHEKSEAVVLAEKLGPTLHPILTLPSLPARRDFAEITVPAGCYFMMGDNRDNSFDSRYFGFVPRASIVGHVHDVVLSFNPAQLLLPRPDRWLTPVL